MKKSLLAAVFAVLILSLAGCLPQQDSSATSDAGFQTAFATKIGSEVVYLDKQVFNAS